jgi:hypothetical protein
MGETITKIIELSCMAFTKIFAKWVGGSMDHTILDWHIRVS